LWKTDQLFGMKWGQKSMEEGKVCFVITIYIYLLRSIYKYKGLLLDYTRRKRAAIRLCDLSLLGLTTLRGADRLEVLAACMTRGFVSIITAFANFHVVPLVFLTCCAVQSLSRNSASTSLVANEFLGAIVSK